MAKSIAKTQREMALNDPPIKANQVWVARGSDRKIIRRIRILAEMPKPTGLSPHTKVWIFEEQPSKMKISKYLGTCPEFNLRYVFRLHGEYDASN